jgi:hypothetical protein
LKQLQTDINVILYLFSLFFSVSLITFYVSLINISVKNVVVVPFVNMGDSNIYVENVVVELFVNTEDKNIGVRNVVELLEISTYVLVNKSRRRVHLR